MKISDIFYSIQGEGSFFGTATIFIRFYNCNLACSFCDEDLHKIIRFEYDEEELLQNIAQYPAKHITLTGGEPSLEDRNPLIERLQAEGYFISVETNGYDFSNISEADWITYSPKDWAAIEFHSPANEIKLVVNDQTKEKELLEIASKTKLPLFLQPEFEPKNSGIQNIHFCRDLILKHPQAFRLSLQAHKLIQIP